MKKLFVLATTAFILAACGGDRGGQSKSSTLRQPVSSRADTIIYQVWMTDGYGRSLPIIDSLAAAGELSPLRVEYDRGIAYVNIGQRQKSAQHVMFGQILFAICGTISPWKSHSTFISSDTWRL